MKSPFKFLDAYEKADKEIFYGRTDEIEQLYKLVYQTNLVLVYGQSGTGKTSLIQCGLANRFKATDWFELSVRRKNNINTSLNREIRRHAQTPIKDGATIVKAVQSLYLDYLRPVYLIFDQFEELFILGSKKEQREFITTIAALLKSDVACKIIFAMREEYIAMLYDFEKAVPVLFNKRLRVEPMSPANVQNVITGTTAAFSIELENGEKTAQQIIDNLSDNRGGVQLSYLQVYLDKLYRKAAKGRNGSNDSAKLIVFSEKLVKQTGALGDVMADFLEEQTTVIQKELKAKYPETPAEAVQITLEEFATLKGTKQPVLREELSDKLRIPDPVLDACLIELENSRILRNIEGVYELAHDTLAGRIAERRSVERKNLLKVQKLIDDRYSAFEQTQTYLSKEELAFIDPYLTKLNLNEVQSGFVKKSASLAEQQIRKEAQRKRSRIYNIVLGIALLISSLSMVAAFLLYVKANKEKQIADKEKQKAVSALNELKREQDARDKLDEKLAFYHINVPNFIGKSVDSARVILGEMGLNMVLVSKKTADHEAGTIIEQNPAAGARLSAVSAVYLTVARRQTEVEKMKDLAKAANLLAGIIAAPEPKIDPYNLTVILPEIAAAMEDSAFLYSVKPLTDNSGIFHRVMKQLQNRIPGIEIPDVANYRTTRDIARWYHEDSTLTFIQDALVQSYLIKPGAVMFYGQRDSVYSQLTPEILFDARRGISHIGVVVSVQRDSNGVVMNYQLFNGHGRQGITPASTTSYHWRNPPRKTYPPYGNGRQQWVAVAPIVRDERAFTILLR